MKVSLFLAIKCLSIKHFLNKYINNKINFGDARLAPFLIRKLCIGNTFFSFNYQPCE